MYSLRKMQFYKVMNIVNDTSNYYRITLKTAVAVVIMVIVV